MNKLKYSRIIHILKKYLTKALNTPKSLKWSSGHAIHKERISNIVQRIKKEAERLEGFEDTRKHNAGRPRTRNMSPEEKIAYLEHKIAYQKQEIEFLKKIRSLEREAYWKLQKKNTKSSKK